MPLRRISLGPGLAMAWLFPGHKRFRLWECQHSQLKRSCDAEHKAARTAYWSLVAYPVLAATSCCRHTNEWSQRWSAIVWSRSRLRQLYHTTLPASNMRRYSGGDQVLQDSVLGDELTTSIVPQTVLIAIFSQSPDKAFCKDEDLR
jgi:hypothetical protein